MSASRASITAVVRASRRRLANSREQMYSRFFIWIPLTLPRGGEPAEEFFDELSCRSVGLEDVAVASFFLDDPFFAQPRQCQVRLVGRDLALSVHEREHMRRFERRSLTFRTADRVEQKKDYVARSSGLLFWGGA